MSPSNLVNKYENYLNSSELKDRLFIQCFFSEFALISQRDVIIARTLQMNNIDQNDDRIIVLCYFIFFFKSLLKRMLCVPGKSTTIFRFF